MNTLFIFGNGFDINLGLNTHYDDFYHYLIATEENNEDTVISHLIQNINESIHSIQNKDDKSIIDWSDLELGLGSYTEFINGVEAAEKIYYKLRQRLSEFIKLSSLPNNFSDLFNGFDIPRFIDQIKNPEQFLKENHIIDIIGFRSHYLGNSSTNILTFNYTKSAEQLLELASKEDLSSLNGNVYHIHRLEDDLIFGVNDTSQIKNEDLAKDEFVTSMYVKPNTNLLFEDRHIVKCKELIRTANLICMFGVSMGDTDREWWNEIGRRINDNNLKIIFHKHETDEEYRDYSNDAPHRFRREVEIRSFVLNQMGISPNFEKHYRNKVYIDIMAKENHIFKIGRVPKNFFITAPII